MNRAGEYGARAAVIEEKQLGGTCVNRGCVPKKIMWYGAQISEAIRDYGPDYGFTSEQTRFDFATLRKNREAYIDRSRNSYDGSFKRNGVERIEGRARFVDAHTVEGRTSYICCHYRSWLHRSGTSRCAPCPWCSDRSLRSR